MASWVPVSSQAKPRLNTCSLSCRRLVYCVYTCNYQFSPWGFYILAITITLLVKIKSKHGIVAFGVCRFFFNAEHIVLWVNLQCHNAEDRPHCSKNYGFVFFYYHAHTLFSIFCRPVLWKILSSRTTHALSEPINSSPIIKAWASPSGSAVRQS